MVERVELHTQNLLHNKLDMDRLRHDARLCADKRKGVRLETRDMELRGQSRERTARLPHLQGMEGDDFQ